MAIAARTATSNTIASGASFTPTLPTGNASGDVIILLVANAGTAGPTKPAGWNTITGSPWSAGTNQSISAFWAYQQNTGNAFTNAASAAAYCCNAYTGCDTVNPVRDAAVAASSASNNTTLPTGAAITGAAANADYEVLAYAWTSAATISSVAAGSTIDKTQANGTSVSCALGHNNTTKLAASTTCTAFSQTLSASNSRKTGVGILLNVENVFAIGGTGTFTVTAGVDAGTIEAATAGAGAFTETGGSGVPVIATAAATGAFSVTSGSATPVTIVTAATGAFTVTGDTNAGTRESVTATGGTFTETGGDAIPLIGTAADTGAFTITGGDADYIILGGDVFIAGEPGAFTVTGNDADTRESVTATGGTYTVTAGVDAGTRESATASTGAFSVSGSDTAPLETVTAATGVFIVTGNDAGIRITGDFIIIGGTGVFTVTGGPAFTDQTGGNTNNAGGASGAFVIPSLREIKKYIEQLVPRARPRKKRKPKPVMVAARGYSARVASGQCGIVIYAPAIAPRVIRTRAGRAGVCFGVTTRVIAMVKITPTECGLKFDTHFTDDEILQIVANL